MLMSALAAMQERNTHLENSLSAETRVKMDLFSALGETKRQLEIQQGRIDQLLLNIWYMSEHQIGSLPLLL